MKVLSDVRRKPRVQTVNTMPSKTVQSDVLRTEIRHILARYKQVGIIDHMASVDLQFRDVTEFTDYADLARQTKEAEQAFMRLPSKVREVFGHDMMNWLDAAHDPEKFEALLPKLEKLGVVEPRSVGPERAPDGRIVNRRVVGELEPNAKLVDRRKPRAKPRVVPRVP